MAETTKSTPEKRVVKLGGGISNATAKRGVARCAKGIVATRVLNTAEGLQDAEDRGILVYLKGMVDEKSRALVLNEDAFPLIPVKDGEGVITGYMLRTGQDTVLGILTKEDADAYRKSQGGTLERFNKDLLGSGSETVELTTLSRGRANLPPNVRKVTLNAPPGVYSDLVDAAENDGTEVYRKAPSR